MLLLVTIHKDISIIHKSTQAVALIENKESKYMTELLVYELNWSLPNLYTIELLLGSNIP
jgi:hypothetical protein